MACYSGAGHMHCAPPPFATAVALMVLMARTVGVATLARLHAGPSPGSHRRAVIMVLLASAWGRPFVAFPGRAAA